MKITVVGLGARAGDISLRGLDAMHMAQRVILRTGKTEHAHDLQRRGILFDTFDFLYERCKNYDDLCAAIAENSLSGNEDTVYAVPGSASLSDHTVVMLGSACHAAGIAFEIIPAAGWESDAASKVGGVERAVFLSAADYAILIPDPRQWLLVTEINRREVAGELKLKLMDSYPDEYGVFFCGESIPLFELDRQCRYGFDSALAVPPLTIGELKRFDFIHLYEIVNRLRDPASGCPWDREQTHTSLKQYLIEEAYETLDAIDSGDSAYLADELGDVLLQIALHSCIADEHGRFTMQDVTTAICRKMIFRHPHVFSGNPEISHEGLSKTWEQKKCEEKKFVTRFDALQDIPRNLPAAMRAQKLLKRAADTGISHDLSQAISALYKALNRFAHEGGDGNGEAVGEMLLTAVDIARLLHVPAEMALDMAANAFLLQLIRTETSVLDNTVNPDDIKAPEV